jgi:hypothetical protein
MTASDAPLVSVLVPLHNAEQFVTAGMRQLLSLDYPRFEVVVVDDGSSDDTVVRCREVVGSDPRVRIVVLPARVGVAAARRQAVLAARGHYLWFCDIDDRWSPAILSVLVREAVAVGADMVCCRAERIELNGRRWIMEGAERPRTLESGCIGETLLTGTVRGFLWNKLFRRELFATVDPVALSSQSDFLMVLEATKQAARVRLIPDVLYRYLEQPTSISAGGALRLSNVEHCHSRAMAELAAGVPVDRRQRTVGYFTTWFLIVPCVTTPVHQGWPRSDAERARHRFGQLLRWPMVWWTLRANPRVGLHALAIKTAGPAFAPIYRSVGRIAGFSLR